ncbi:MAG: nuclear transport factor 2 family protein, partial [Bacteroidales bacterium]
MWIFRTIYLITFLAAVSAILSCSTSPRPDVESVVPGHVAKQEENKRKVIYFFDEVVGHGNEEAVKALLAPDCRYYDAGKVKTTNIQEFIDYLRRARMPYESIEIEIDNIVAEGNWVAVRYAYHS